MRLECPVEIGEVLEPAAGSDAQLRVIRCVHGVGSGIEPAFLDKSNEVQDYGRGIPIDFNKNEEKYNF